MELKPPPALGLLGHIVCPGNEDKASLNRVWGLRLVTKKKKYLMNDDDDKDYILGDARPLKN